MSTAAEWTGGSAANAVTPEVSRRSEVLRRALIELKAARAEAAEARRVANEPVAVVGMGCRFPGGVGDVEGFWDLLVSGRSGVVEVPADRWSVGDFFDPDPDAVGRTYSRHGGFVEGVREFDAGLFGVPPREAVGVDPQHRFVLEVAWEALEHAGVAPDSLRGSRTGVFVGMGGSDYERLNLSTGDVSTLDAHSVTGGALNMAANRLSYVLGLEGPSLVVDTACSSSLVAVHLACQALRLGECETALVAGVNLMLSPGTTVALSKGRMLSPEGRCKTFDADADGYVRGEGCGVVVLQRLAAASESGRSIRAVIKGSAINQDGKSSGLTVPRASAQQDVLRRALAVAGVRPADVGYVEAHGTGTALGDPIEVRALAAVLGEGRDVSRRVALGSVKTNIGHLEAAAGIAGLIKTVLVVERGIIPQHLNLTLLNPLIAWDELPVTVPTSATPWPDEHRIAGVSSFGFGGTNAHVVVESPPAAPEPTELTGPVVVKLTGRGEAALRAGAQRLASWVRDAEPAGVDLAGLAWSAGVGRAELSDRAAVVAGSSAEVVAGLDAVAQGRAAAGVARGRRRPGGPSRVAFVVPGGAPGLAGVLATLYGQDLAVTDVVDEIADALGPVSALPLSVLLDAGEESAVALANPAVANPAWFTVAVALGRWWESVGVRPDVILGHHAGAYAAAALAGVWSPADGARLVVALTAGEPLAETLEKLTLRVPDVDLVSDVDAAVTGPEVTTAGYWLRQAGEPGTLVAPVRAVLDSPVRAVIELGPGELGPAFLAAADERDLVCVPSLVPDLGARRGLLESAIQVWAEGVEVDWTRVNGTRPARVPVLPTYPFQRQTYWPDTADPRASLVRAPRDGSGSGSGLAPRILCTATGETVGETEVSLRRVPFLQEHRVHERIVVPGVLFLELVLRCAERVFDGAAQAQHLAVSRPLVLGDGDTASVQVVIDRPVAGCARARVFSKDSQAQWQLHFQTLLNGAETAEPPAGAADDATFAAGADRCTEIIAAREFYRCAWHPLFRLGPSFQLVNSARRGVRAAVGTLVQPTPEAAGIGAGIRPELLLLDACIQLVVAAALSGAGCEDRPVHLGTGYDRISVQRKDFSGELECVAVLRDTPDGSVLGDLRLFDSCGRLVAEVWGVSFRPVTEQMLTRLVADRATAGGESYRPALPVPDLAALRAMSESQCRRILVGHLVQDLALILGSAPEDVDPDVAMVDLADSLMIAELRTDIEEHLALTVPMELFFDGSTLTTLAHWITVEGFAGTAQPAPAPEPVATAPAEPAVRARRRPASPRVQPMTVQEMTALAELEASIAPTGDPQPPGTAPEATLLTGSTGFVGAFLLGELLHRRHGDVHCLVRAGDPEHAMRRIVHNLRFYGIDPELHRSRIVPVVGDLAKPLFGLDDKDFTALHDGIGDIVHCGGTVKWTYPYGRLQGANVAGTREVLRLAARAAPRPVHFISTVGVFSSKDYTPDVVRESTDMHTSGSLVVGYAQTKWVAERMVRSAHERGLPVTVHRINTGGHSVTGAFNRLDHLTMILKGCIEAGIAPHSLAVMPVQPAPIDYVASAVVELSMRPELDGATFHLVNARAMTWQELFDAVAEFGYPLERVSLDAWRDRVTGRNAGTMALLGLAPFLHESLDHVRLPFSDSAYTRLMLQETEVRCPPLDTGLVHTFLNGFVDAGFIEPPVRTRPATTSSKGIST